MNQTIQVIRSVNNDLQICYRFKKYPQDTYTQEALATSLILDKGIGNKRFYLDMQGDWEILHLKEVINTKARYLFDVPQPQNTKFILLPFLFCQQAVSPHESKIIATDEQLNKLCEWVQKNLETPASLEDIKASYKKLIDYIDNDVMKNSPFWDKWKKAREIE